ncbi:unnamed protein product [Closterium sp. NIES-65]|nr:unnamed protein product [Closterium sp. NIES-65]
MPPKGSRKAVVDPLVADTNTPTDPALSTAEGKNEESVITAAQVVDNAAGSSGLSVEEKCDTTVDLDDAVEKLMDDSDDELDVDFKADELCRLRYTAILLVPFLLHHELASVVSTVRLLMRRVWSSVVSADVANTSKFQILHPAYVAKTRFCMLQISFLLEGDALNVRQQDVDYQRVNGKLVRLYWLRADDPSFVRERASNPLATEVVFRHVSASVSPETLQWLLAHYKLKINQKLIYKEGLSASLRVNPLRLPIVLDPAVALISTGNLREEWLCTQTGYRKAHGTFLMDDAAHIKQANHLQHLETLGTATKPTLEKASLSAIRKDYGI